MKTIILVCLVVSLTIIGHSQTPKLGLGFFLFKDAETDETIDDISIQFPHEPDYVIDQGALKKNKEEKGISYTIVQHPEGYTEIVFISHDAKTFVIKSKNYEDSELVITPKEYYTLSKGPNWSPETIKLKKKR